MRLVEVSCAKRAKDAGPKGVWIKSLQPSSVLAPSSEARTPSSFLLLVLRPGAPGSVLAPKSDGLQPTS